MKTGDPVDIAADAGFWAFVSFLVVVVLSGLIVTSVGGALDYVGYLPCRSGRMLGDCNPAAHVEAIGGELVCVCGAP